MADEMVERCANEVIAAGYNPATAGAIVRITIAALREPTKAMIADDYFDTELFELHRDDDTAGIWRLLIDRITGRSAGVDTDG